MTVQYQGVWTLQNAAQLQSTQRWVTDPLYKNTTLLLQADDAANGAQNNTFLDSSSNNFAITRNPASGPNAPTQGSFTPFSQAPGYWGAYLTSVYGSSTFTSRTLFNGNSTIELWVYPNALSGQQTFVRGGGLNFGTNGSKLRIDDGVNAGSVFESTGTIVPNLWNHVAVVRTSNTFAFYINGNLDSSNASISSFYASNATDLNVGAFNSGGANAFAGYLSNIRVSNVARTISAPTIPYSSDANTVWLIFQSNRFVDNSSNAYALTFVGTPSVQAFSPFAPQFQWTPSVIGGSGYFDGDSLQTTGANTNLSIGTGDFTFECWAYLLSGSGDPGIMQIAGGPFGTNLPAYANSIGIFSITSSGLWALINNGGFTAGSISRVLNAWTHLAVCRSGTTHRLFVNGVQAASVSDSSNYTTQYFAAGCAYGTNFPSNAYISNIRFVRGTAVYTGAFTPPTRPLSASGAASASAYPSTTNVNTSFAASATSLFLNFTNASIVDGTMKNNWETVGNAQISTAVAKYGSGSMFFDGSGDYLDSPSIINAQFGTGDLTIEGWLYITSLAITQVVFEFRATNGVSYGQIYITTGGVLRFYLPSDVGTSNTFTTNVWTHFAVTRSAGILRMFINGVQGYSNTYTTAMDAGRLRIGADVGGASNFSGYMDDLRITKGIARYTQNFIPPSVALPRQ